MLERVSRAIEPAERAPSTSAGRMRWFTPSVPEEGSQRSLTLITRMARMASQKSGIETANSDEKMLSESSQVLRFMAEMTPSVTPMITASTTAVPASWMDQGRASAMRVPTGRLLRMDVPRSPWKACCTKCRYWTGRGSFRPNFSRARAMTSGPDDASKPLISSRIGSPGMRCSMANASTVTPNSTGTAATRRPAKKRAMRSGVLSLRAQRGIRHWVRMPHFVRQDKGSSPGVWLDPGGVEVEVGAPDIRHDVVDALLHGQVLVARDERHVGDDLLGQHVLDLEVQVLPLGGILLLVGLLQHLVELVVVDAVVVAGALGRLVLAVVVRVQQVRVLVGPAEGQPEEEVERPGLETLVLGGGRDLLQLQVHAHLL